MKLVLKVSDIWKEYMSVPVLKGCSFSFERQGIYALTGPNGSGKSTFLRICALIEAPDRGEVSYISDDTAVRFGLELRRRMTLLLPRIGVFNTSVFKNAAYGLNIRGLDRDKVEEKVDRILSSVGLYHKKKQNALTLSSGEAQRLGLARAMVVEPEILFLDEPTASVDQENRKIIEEIIMKMKEDRSATVVITTHDGRQAERLGDTLLVMEDGKIAAT